MLPWTQIPDVLIPAIALVALALRDRWLSTAALVLSCNIAAMWAVTAYVGQDCAWAYEALIDLATATILAWPMHVRGVVLACAIGINVTFDLIIGASKAFGSHYAQASVTYHAWWAMEYLAFGILALLTIAGFEDHGGKQVRSHIADYLRRTRRSLLESHGAHHPASHCGLEGESIGIIW